MATKKKAPPKPKSKAKAAPKPVPVKPDKDPRAVGHPVPAHSCPSTEQGHERQERATKGTNGKKIGRPTTFTQKVADTICERIAAGESLRKITADPGMPCQTAVFSWLARHEAFAQQYARAREQQMDAMAEELLEIADDGTNDFKLDKDGNEVLDSEHIQRSRLRVDTRKWLMSKLKPKKYGEKIEHEHQVNAVVGLYRRLAGQTGG